MGFVVGRPRMENGDFLVAAFRDRAEGMVATESSGRSWISGFFVCRTDVDGNRRAVTPFGVFTYNAARSEEIADELIRLAGLIRKEGRG